MEAGFKIEGFACFVSETSRNINAKEQWLPKGVPELLVSHWGWSRHIPQLPAPGWEEPQFQPRSAVCQGPPPLGAAASLFGS